MKILPKKTGRTEDLRARISQERNRNQERNSSIAKEGNGPSDSSVRISAIARELGAIELPDNNTVRADKVAELKARIESGNYRVNSEELARKILGF